MKKLLAILLCVVLVLGAAACTAKIEPSQGVTDTEIRVGNSAATSGGFAIVGEPLNAGIEAYFRMVNEGGGIDGRTITFWHTDDEFDPAKGKAALEEMVEDEKLFAIVGAMGTPVIAAIIDDMKAYGIPCVYFATGIPQLLATGATTNEEGYNIFPVQPLYETEGRILTAYATGKFNATKIGVIYTNDDAGITLHKGVVAQVEELAGVELVAEQVAAGTADASAAVTSLKNAGVDIVIVAAIQATCPTIVKELAAQGMSAPVLTTYSNAGIDTSTAVVEAITGRFDVYATAWVDATDLEAYMEFATWVAPEYAANAYAMAGWIAGAAFVEGLRRVEGKPLTWENYMKALESAPIKLPFGAAVDYANGNRWGTQAMSLSKVVPISDLAPMGWENVEPVTNIADLLK
ncbi:MAG: ABC transporter substrate-binding protein [Clostridiales bacterium]|nr:ABC transporter substrate-binding protein [Clostridiales bacterium]